MLKMNSGSDRARTSIARFARRLVVGLSLLLTVAACASIKEDTEDAKKARAAIKAELGYDSLVMFQTEEGGKVNVNVLLPRKPAEDPTEIKRKVSAVVAKSFRNHVDAVDVVIGDPTAK
jgi:hypothetical protein